jgi:hypothetical protein
VKVLTAHDEWANIVIYGLPPKFGNLQRSIEAHKFIKCERNNILKIKNNLYLYLGDISNFGVVFSFHFYSIFLDKLLLLGPLY